MEYTAISTKHPCSVSTHSRDETRNSAPRGRAQLGPQLEGNYCGGATLITGGRRGRGANYQPPFPARHTATIIIRNSASFSFINSFFKPYIRQLCIHLVSNLLRADSYFAWVTLNVELTTHVAVWRVNIIVDESHCRDRSLFAFSCFDSDKVKRGLIRTID